MRMVHHDRHHWRAWSAGGADLAYGVGAVLLLLLMVPVVEFIAGGAFWLLSQF